MIALIAGLLLFMGIHLLPSMPDARGALIARVGPGAYKGLFSLVAGIGFGLIIWGKGNADFVAIWEPPNWSRIVVQLAMLPALVLLVAAYLPNNLRRLTPHPMMWATLIWGLAHLTANGDLGSMLLFGSFVVFAVFQIQSANRRGKVSPATAQPWYWDLLTAVAGLAAYAAFAHWHAMLFRVPAFT